MNRRLCAAAAVVAMALVILAVAGPLPGRARPRPAGTPLRSATVAPAVTDMPIPDHFLSGRAELPN